MVECTWALLMYLLKATFVAFIYIFIVVCIEFGLLVMALRPVVQSSMNLDTQSVHFRHSEVAEPLTAVAVVQTMAMGTLSSVACGPCEILDLKHWPCFLAKDIPCIDVKTNSFNTTMIHGCQNGFVWQRRPTNYMADKT